MALHGCFTFILENGKDVMSVVFSDIQCAHWKDGKLTIVLRGKKVVLTTTPTIEQAQEFFDAWFHAIRVAEALSGADQPMITSMEIVDIKLA